MLIYYQSHILSCRFTCNVT